MSFVHEDAFPRPKLSRTSFTLLYLLIVTANLVLFQALCHDSIFLLWLPSLVSRLDFTSGLPSTKTCKFQCLYPFHVAVMLFFVESVIHSDYRDILPFIRSTLQPSPFGLSLFTYFVRSRVVQPASSRRRQTVANKDEFPVENTPSMDMEPPKPTISNVESGNMQAADLAAAIQSRFKG